MKVVFFRKTNSNNQIKNKNKNIITFSNQYQHLFQLSLKCDGLINFNFFKQFNQFNQSVFSMLIEI